MEENTKTIADKLNSIIESTGRHPYSYLIIELNENEEAIVSITP